MLKIRTIFVPIYSDIRSPSILASTLCPRPNALINFPFDAPYKVICSCIYDSYTIKKCNSYGEGFKTQRLLHIHFPGMFYLFISLLIFFSEN